MCVCVCVCVCVRVSLLYLSSVVYNFRLSFDRLYTVDKPRTESDTSAACIKMTVKSRKRHFYMFIAGG